MAHKCVRITVSVLMKEICLFYCRCIFREKKKEEYIVSIENTDDLIEQKESVLYGLNNFPLENYSAS